MLLNHHLQYAQYIARLVEKGGDWDRRNLLKVYRGLHSLSIRQFKRGGELLLDALSTFTATELISYNDFVASTIIANVLTLSRPDLKKKVCAAVSPHDDRQLIVHAAHHSTGSHPGLARTPYSLRSHEEPLRLTLRQVLRGSRYVMFVLSPEHLCLPSPQPHLSKHT